MLGMCFSHAGTVLFKIENNKIYFLLITARHNNQEWVLPKGHRERFEFLKKTALRELEEETGLKGEIICTLGKDQYSYKGEQIKVRFYLAKFKGEKESIHCEAREKDWCEYDEALVKLSFPSQRQLIKKAFSILKDKETKLKL